MEPDAADNLLHFFNPGALPYALLLVIGTIILMRFLSRLGDRISERMLQHRLAIKQANTVIAFAAYGVVAVLASSSLFTLSSEAVLALSGTIAVVLGFAFKDVASSFLAGLSILANKPFQVGDRISFGGFYGEVTEMGLRTVRLVTLDDNLVTIPSNRFLSDPVASANAGALDCMVVVKFWLKTHIDHRHARSIIRDAVLATPYLYLGKPVKMLVGTRITDDGKAFVELTAKAYVYDARHESAFSSDVCDRVLTAFRAEGWELGV